MSQASEKPNRGPRKLGNPNWKKGQSANPAGRRPGVANRMTRAAKEAFELAFEALGGSDALAAWARRNKTEFYRLYARLIPLNVNVDTTTRVLSYAERMSQEVAAAGTAEALPERSLQ